MQNTIIIIIIMETLTTNFQWVICIYRFISMKSDK